MTEAQQPLPSQPEEKRLAQIEYLKEYRLKNADTIAAKAKAKYQKNRDTILAQKKEYTKKTTERRKAYQTKHYAENKERILASAAKARQGKEKELAAWQRKYRKSNPELVRQRDREYYKKHREKNLQQKSEWGKTTEGRIKQNAKNQTRRARKNSVVSTLTAPDLREIRDKAKGTCFYCHAKTNLTLDHVIPISKGGGHTRDNVVMACRSCNSSKGSKDPLIFAKERGLLLI
jgi:5-methylcytosine-specific restriction endonuclease McrA